MTKREDDDDAEKQVSEYVPDKQVCLENTSYIVLMYGVMAGIYIPLKAVCTVCTYSICKLLIGL